MSIKPSSDDERASPAKEPTTPPQRSLARYVPVIPSNPKPHSRRAIQKRFKKYLRSTLKYARIFTN